MVGGFSLAHFSLTTGVKINPISAGLNHPFAWISLVGNYHSILPLSVCHGAKQVPLSLKLPNHLAPVLTLSPPQHFSCGHWTSTQSWVLYSLKAASGPTQHVDTERTLSVTAQLLLQKDAIRKNGMVAHTCDHSRG